MRKESEKGRRSVCSEEEDAVHILLKCSEIGSGGNNS
jgi:hypothetical protein